MFRFGDAGSRIYGVVGTGNANQLALWNGPNNNPGQFSVGLNQGVTIVSALNALAFTTSNSLANTSFVSTVLDNQSRWGLSCYIKLDYFIINNPWPVFSFYDGATTQVDVRIKFDGTLQVTRNGTVLGTTSFSLGRNVWNHVEVLFNISPTAGTCNVWINRMSGLSLTGVNTSNTGSTTASAFYLGCPLNLNTIFRSNSITYFDNIIVYDGQPNDAAGHADISSQIGDCHLEWLIPNGVGTNSQWSSTGATNYGATCDGVPDGDNSYVYATTVGSIDTYAAADPYLSGNAKSIAVLHYAKKTDSNPRTMSAAIVNGGNPYTHPKVINLGNSYAYDFSNWGTQPQDGSAWTNAALVALEVGQKIIS